MLAGLTSRWTRPARWAASSASATCGADVDDLPAGHAARRRRAAARSVVPVDQLHHDGLDAVVGAGVVDRHDRRVVRAGRRPRPRAEARDERVVGGQVGVEDLHRHLAAEHLVGGLPHLGHAAAGDAVGRGGSGRRGGGPGCDGSRRVTDGRVRTSGTAVHRYVSQAGVSRASSQVTPMTPGPPWVPMTAPILPMRTASRGKSGAMQRRGTRRCRAHRRGRRDSCSTAPARRRACRASQTQRLLAGALLAGLLDLAGADVDDAA